MKSYSKNPPPTSLQPWHGTQQPWENFREDTVTYNQVKSSLKDEQQHLCCYCEFLLQDGDNHIEHFQPRHGINGNTNLIFDYANLGCSCNGGTDRNRCCGQYKGSKYDAAKFVNPSVSNTDSLFSYTTNGAISCADGLTPSEQTQASYMIDLLNLKCPHLTHMRRNHAAALVAAIDGLIQAGAEDQIAELSPFYLAPDSNGKMHQFYSLSRQMFGQ